jgi:phage portal protein BeeE
VYGLMGDNVIARAAKALGVAAAQERFAASYFGQGAQPGGVLEERANTLSDQAYERMKTDWMPRSGKGPENAHKPMILEEGMEWNADHQSNAGEGAARCKSRKYSA